MVNISKLKGGKEEKANTSNMHLTATPSGVNMSKPIP